MEKELQKLIDILETDDIIISKANLNEVELYDGFDAVFRKLLPDRYCSYDTEIIDDAGGYHFVISPHIEATLSEWIPDNITITGDIDSKISIEFSHNGKKVKWLFEQYGSDYVSEEFYKKLNSWVSRNLSGRFLTLNTGDQGIAFVYLPKKIATKVSKFIKSFISIDDFVERFRCGSEIPEEFYTLRDNNSFDMNSVDSSGETALTAAIKNRNIKMATAAIEFEFASTLAKNLKGETPLQIARQMNLQEFTSFIESQDVYPYQNWADLEWSYKNSPLDDDITMGMLVERIQLDNKLIKTYQCLPVLWNVFFGLSETIELGHETLYVRIISENRRQMATQAFNVEYSSEKGIDKDYALKDITLDEVMECLYRFYDIN